MKPSNQTVEEKLLKQLRDAAGDKTLPQRVLRGNDGKLWVVLLPTPLAASLCVFYGRDPHQMILPQRLVEASVI